MLVIFNVTTPDVDDVAQYLLTHGWRAYHEWISGSQEIYNSWVDDKGNNVYLQIMNSEWAHDVTIPGVIQTLSELEGRPERDIWMEITGIQPVFMHQEAAEIWKKELQRLMKEGF